MPLIRLPNPTIGSLDPAGEVFFSTSDVDFGDGTGSGNPSEGTSGGGTTPGGGGTTPGGGGTTPGGGGTTPGSGTTTPSGPQLAAVEFREDSRWNTGFTGTIRVTNKGTNLIDGWTLAFQLNGTISTSWSAVNQSKTGSTYTFINESWNGRIAPGATVSFGFQAAAGAGVKPTGFLLNGKAPDPVCGTPAPTTPVAAQLALKVSSNWGTGFTADAALKNLSSRDLNGWTTTFDFPHRITTLWNAELVARSGNRYTIKNAPWNAPLKAGATVSFGFNAEPGGVIQPPTNVTLK